MKRIYIAGPMSGWPDNNYPAFNAKAEELRAEGWAVENPAENPVPECGTWLGYMRMALRQLALCDAIYLLPWHETSRGASIERNLALALGLKVIEPETSRRDGAQQWGAVGLIETIAQWFVRAVPEPTAANTLVQLGCHFEEVDEMLTALKKSDDDVCMGTLADALKQAAGEDPKEVEDFMAEFAPQFDMPELLDALCDQIVTAVGVAHMMGFDLPGALAEVNRANWSKFVDGAPLFDSNGKITKGPLYLPPRLAPFVGGQHA